MFPLVSYSSLSTKVKVRKNYLLKKQVNSPDGANNETDLCIRTDIKFKKEIMKILKEL